MDPTRVLCDRWFDGETHRREPVTLRLAAGRIAAVEEGHAPPGDGMLDARGRLVLPGLINAHAHVARAGFFEAEEPPLLARQIAMNLLGALAAGITTVADMGCTVPMLQALRALTDRDPLAGPRVLGAGPIVTAPDGYPFNWVSPLWRHAEAAIGVDSEPAARRAVARAIGAGMDHLKIAVMHESFAREPLPALSPAAARGVVAEAHAHGRRVYAHAHSNRDYEVSLDAGVSALMHSSFEPLPAELVARIRDAGVPVCPTLWAYEGACLTGDCRADLRPELAAHATRSLRRSWRRFAEAYAASGDVFPDDSVVPRVRKEAAREAMRVAGANLRLLRDAGVPIVFGNDASFGLSLLARPIDELAAMRRAGLSVDDCLRAATSAAADALARPDLGRLRAGGSADLIVAPAALEHDLDALDADRAPLIVIARGRRVPPSLDIMRVAGVTRAYLEGTAITLGKTIRSVVRSALRLSPS